MSDLHATYGAKGLEILAFQCSQFLDQAPGTDEEFLNTLKYVRPGKGYVPSFPIFSKVEVNGGDAHSFWQAVRASCPMSPTLGGQICPYDVIKWKPVTPADVAWNFEKVLISKKGVPVRRFSADSEKEPLAQAIEGEHS